jgi:hypothetical protein
MRKQVVTLNIGNHLPSVTPLTLPTIRHYAQKIGAEFKIIDTPKIKMQADHGGEKFQLYELSEGYDWTLYLDSDVLVHPNNPDWSEMVTKDTVIFHGLDMYLNRFRATQWNRRSGSLRGACTWFTFFSDWCRDLWHPPELSWEESLQHITPVVEELRSGHCPAAHLIDDFTVSCNMARYGLRTVTLMDGLYKQCPGDYFFHLYMTDEATKLVEIRKKMQVWGLGVEA